MLSPLPFVAFIGNTSLLKTLRVDSRPSKGALTLSRVFVFLNLPSFVFGLNLLVKFYDIF